MHEWQSLSHVRWECKYHVVIIPKYRRKVFYGRLRHQIGPTHWGFPPHSPQRGLPHVDGPLGGAFLRPRPSAVVAYYVLNPRPLAVGPEELRAIRRAFIRK